MEYKAIVSFSGVKISMFAGQVRDISDPALAERLEKAGYIMPVVADVPEPKAEPEPEPPKVEKKSSTRGKGKKKDED